MVTFFYDIEFVSGILTGIVLEQKLSYPLSSYQRERTKFEEQISNQTVIKSFGGSSYKILKFRETVLN